MDGETKPVALKGVSPEPGNSLSPSTPEHPQDATTPPTERFKYWVALSFDGANSRGKARLLRSAFNERFGRSDKVFYDDDDRQTFVSPNAQQTVKDIYEHSAMVVVVLCPDYFNNPNARPEFIAAWSRSPKHILIVPESRDQITPDLNGQCHICQPGCRISEIVDYVTVELKNLLGFDVSKVGQALHYFLNWHEAALNNYGGDLEKGCLPNASADVLHLFNSHVALAGSLGLCGSGGQIVRVARKLADVSDAAWLLKEAMPITNSNQASVPLQAGQERYSDDFVEELHHELCRNIEDLLDEFLGQYPRQQRAEPDEMTASLADYLLRYATCFRNDVDTLTKALLSALRAQRSDPDLPTDVIWKCAKSYSEALCLGLDNMLSTSFDRKKPTVVHRVPTESLPDATTTHIERIAPHLRRYL